MRILSIFIINIAACFLLQPYLPWWVIGLICFATAYYSKLTIGKAFLTGFFSIFMAWAGLAAFIDYQNAGLLSAKIAALLHLPNKILLIVITGLIGGLVGGLSALTGSLARR